MLCSQHNDNVVMNENEMMKNILQKSFSVYLFFFCDFLWCDHFDTNTVFFSATTILDGWCWTRNNKTLCGNWNILRILRNDPPTSKRNLPDSQRLNDIRNKECQTFCQSDAQHKERRRKKDQAIVAQRYRITLTIKEQRFNSRWRVWFLKLGVTLKFF